MDTISISEEVMERGRRIKYVGVDFMGTLPTVQTQLVSTPTGLRLEQIRNRIRMACEKAGRDPGSITILGATRTLMVDPVLDGAHAGITHFSEDYLPEGVTKRLPVDHQVRGLSWHFSGTLTNKGMPLAVEFFDWIHGFDRMTLLRRLVNTTEKKEKTGLRIVIEVNPLGNRKRTGASPQDVPGLIAALGDAKTLRFSGLSFKSETFMAPQDRLEGYDNTAQLFESLGLKGEHELVMGTSKDFEYAVLKGATMLRLGTVLFGPRPGTAPQDF